jgi:hypothetical protein
MNTHMTLTSLAELSIEKLVMAMDPPTSGRLQPPGRDAVASPRDAREATRSGDNTSAPTHLPRHTADKEESWYHWGLND